MVPLLQLLKEKLPRKSIAFVGIQYGLLRIVLDFDSCGDMDSILAYFMNVIAEREAIMDRDQLLIHLFLVERLPSDVLVQEINRASSLLSVHVPYLLQIISGDIVVSRDWSASNSFDYLSFIVDFDASWALSEGSKTLYIIKDM